VNEQANHANRVVRTALSLRPRSGATARRIAALLGAVGLALATLPLAALADEPAGRDDAVEPAEVVIEPRGGGIEATPTGDASGRQFPLEIGQTMFQPSATHLIPEATILVDRRGRVHRLESGRLVFVFDADASGQADPPMFLQPCVATMQIERLIADRGPATTIRLTGQVTAYRGWNYLRPTTFSILDSLPAASPPARPAPGASSPSHPTPAPASPTSLDELFSQPVRSGDGQSRTAAQVLAELESRPTEEGVYTPPPVIEISDARGVLAEGRVLVSRRGRLRTHAGGGLEFVFDTGPNDPPGLDQPLILMPCLLLERIEAAAGRRRHASLTLSGRVYGYGDRAFLLPTMFVIERSRHDNLVPAH
jgi:hypothetical protein